MSQVNFNGIVISLQSIVLEGRKALGGSIKQSFASLFMFRCLEREGLGSGAFGRELPGCLFFCLCHLTGPSLISAFCNNYPRKLYL